MPTHVEHHEKLTIPLGLAVFASDLLSSSAYATEEILIALVGSVFAVYANLISIPIALAIGILLVVVIISYRQVIRAYPHNGGAYVVSKENLGVLPSMIVGAALLLDYILTVAVSISAGVAAITSTGWVAQEYQVGLALIFVLFITFLNLRGVRESGKVIAFPAYFFILSMFLLLGLGVWKSVTGAPLAGAASPMDVIRPDMWSSLTFGLPLILVFMNGFAHGCAALTGIEAVSNGVDAFKAPADVRANRTMVIMAILLGSIFVGTTYLAFIFHVTPSHHETVISQIARATFGGANPFYFMVQISTMVILILAANTSFAGFPRLASLLAGDGYLPRQLTTLGDKLVFSNGIILLGLISGLLIWFYNADTHALIPLYAVGVFITFTVAQAGMVVYQLREKKSGWQWGLLMNAFGSLVTGLVAILLAVEKFWEGGWIVLVAIPLMIAVFLKIYYHYKSVSKQLILPEKGYCPTPVDHTVLVLVSSLNRGTIPALEYARTISKRVEAVHVELRPEATEHLRKQWEEWGCGVPLVVLPSPYRSINEPILDYIEQVDARYENDIVTVIVPEFVTKKFWHNLLHNQTALVLKAMLRGRRGKVVISVRYHLEE